MQQKRVSEFVNKMTLSKYQRYFINKFRKYKLNSAFDLHKSYKEADEYDQHFHQSGYCDEQYTLQMQYNNVEQLQVDDRVDRRIIYEMAGISIDLADRFSMDYENSERSSMTSSGRRSSYAAMSRLSLYGVPNNFAVN